MFKVFEGVPKKKIIVDILLSCLWSAFNCYYVLILASLTESVVNDLDNLPMLIIAYTIYLSLWIVLEFVGDVHQSLSATAIENGVSELYLKRVYHIKPTILKKYNSGYISGLLSRLITKQETLYAQVVTTAPLSVFYICFFTYQVGMYHWIYGVLLLLISVIAILFQWVGGLKFVVDRAKELGDAEATRDKLIVDSVINIGTVQKMQALEFIENKMYITQEDCRKKTYKFSIVNEIFFCGVKYISYIYLPLCLFVHHFILSSKTYDYVGFFSLLSVICVQLVHMVKALASVYKHYFRFKGNKEKIDAIVNEANNRNNLNENEFRSARIHNLDYTYQGENENKEEYTVHIRIPEFEVNQGDVICVYGESGQGKTTLLHVLSGEIETDSVFINGIQTDKRLECVFIAQDTEILDMNLRDNLVLGADNIPDSLLLEYIEEVGLKDWFEKQKEGLDTLLGERGVFVSTGQRQRLNLIRGLLRQDKEIYLLDEPTSNVDVETEEKMIALIKKTLKDKTVVIVTHRPKIIEICNHCYKFEKGLLEKVR